MDMVVLGNAFGIISLIPVVVVLVCNRGCKPHEFMTPFLGCFMVFSAVMTASTFSNLNDLAKLLDAKHMLGQHSLDQSNRAANLWLLIYPAMVGALGVNLLTSWFQSKRPTRKWRWVATGELVRKSNGDLKTGGRPTMPVMASTRRRCKVNVRADLVRRR